ncbi:hypothetical protein TL16_g03974 [Triparma laevis f. inornata]|uniref:Uncharacterized protein n=2 Tax=Triparma laevis TaxID=1534972 RepID=A0A9W7F2S7_9STRA|nr:hypothetical protein TL16_g03974 [Triparma laevis f. inornata]GMH99407.1 hypothetical protein TrLO_g140 [Triparma laevis f. longispina]
MLSPHIITRLFNPISSPSLRVLSTTASSKGGGKKWYPQSTVEGEDGISKTKQKRKAWFKKQKTYTLDSTQKLSDIKTLSSGLRSLAFFENESSYHRSLLNRIKRSTLLKDLLSILETERFNNLTTSQILNSLSLLDPSNSTSNSHYEKLINDSITSLKMNKDCRNLGGPKSYSLLRLALSRIITSEIPPSTKADSYFHEKSYSEYKLDLLESCLISGFSKRHPDVVRVLKGVETIAGDLNSSRNFGRLGTNAASYAERDDARTEIIQNSSIL